MEQAIYYVQLASVAADPFKSLFSVASLFGVSVVSQT